MKKYNVQLAILVLFSALFAPGGVIGMDPTSLYELRRTGKEVPSLPSDVQKIIASKMLRVILDEAEDKPEMLLEKQWRWPKNVKEVFTSFSIAQEKGSMF